MEFIFSLTLNTHSHLVIMSSEPSNLIHWVECSTCSKWRIVPPRPDGSQEEIPDIWYCEMNTDLLRNSCEAPEEEYKAPAAVRRLPKSNDPDSIRSVLKNLSEQELEAAYKSLDIDRIFREEFGDNLASARATNLVRYISTKKIKKSFDLISVRAQVVAITEEAKGMLPENIVDQFTK